MERMRGPLMARDEGWSPVRVYVSDSVHMALFDHAANRQKEEPDNTVSYLAGRIADEALRHYLNVED